MSQDPTITDPTLYRVVFENERVRVLEYRDGPGDRTHPHTHTVMYTLSSFSRRLSTGGRQVEVELPANRVRWVSAQEHAGENTGSTETHALFIELKEPAPAGSGGAPALGPSAGA